MTVIVAVLLSSCTKNETVNEDKTYFKDITGTYSGEFTSSTLQNAVPGTAVVTETDNDELLIHCFGDILDTTMHMDAYENGDSIMVCNTDDDFYNEYGHMGSGKHMMDMNDDETEWAHHMEDDHQAGDEHYGGFDMQHHTMDYMFRMMVNDSLINIQFHGLKK